MTEPLYLLDAYLRDAPGRVVGHTEEGGILLNQSVFYPTGGGQPGDSGKLTWEGGEIEIATSVRAGSDIVLVPAEPMPLPPIGADVSQALDWERRYAHMRVHTALHLLSVVVPLPVTGGQIGAEKGRLDFLMADPLEDKDALLVALNKVIMEDHPVDDTWITDAELDAHPDLVKTMSVKPPKGAGRVRLVQIGAGSVPVDLQPCGGTHVKRTGEIGVMTVGKVEKKGRENRRINIHLMG